MDRYQRVEKPRAEHTISDNEIRITSQGLIRNYISYATSIFQDKRAIEVVLKAMGQAISKAVTIAEIIKTRIPGLYQNITISSNSITDVWEPIEEGLVPLETTRHVSMIAITLSTRDLKPNTPGYQAPLNVGHSRQQPRQQIEQLQVDESYHQPRQAQNPYNEDYYGRGQGRRGRGFRRGGYRGGYNGYDVYGGYGIYQDDGNWNWGRGGGHGRRGWSYHGGGYERGRGGRGYGGRGYDRGRGRSGHGRGNMAE